MCGDRRPRRRNRASLLPSPCHCRRGTTGSPCKPLGRWRQGKPAAWPWRASLVVVLSGRRIRRPRGQIWRSSGRISVVWLQSFGLRLAAGGVREYLPWTCVRAARAPHAEREPTVCWPPHPLSAAGDGVADYCWMVVKVAFVRWQAFAAAEDVGHGSGVTPTGSACFSLVGRGAGVRQRLMWVVVVAGTSCAAGVGDHHSSTSRVRSRRGMEAVVLGLVAQLRCSMQGWCQRPGAEA